MSAFVVNKAHIDALIEAGLTEMPRSHSPLSWYPARGVCKKLTRDTDNETGQMLIDACVASVGHRYPKEPFTELPGPTDAYWVLPYRFAPCQKQPTIVETIKLIKCFEYQSCEHPDWETSEAHKFCEALMDAMINALPGYDDAPWEWEDALVTA